MESWIMKISPWEIICQCSSASEKDLLSCLHEVANMLRTNTELNTEFRTLPPTTLHFKKRIKNTHLRFQSIMLQRITVAACPSKLNWHLRVFMDSVLWFPDFGCFSNFGSRSSRSSDSLQYWSLTLASRSHGNWKLPEHRLRLRLVSDAQRAHPLLCLAS